MQSFCNPFQICDDVKLSRCFIQGSHKTKIKAAVGIKYMFCMKYIANVTYVELMSFGIKAVLCNDNDGFFYAFKYLQTYILDYRGSTVTVYM